MADIVPYITLVIVLAVYFAIWYFIRKRKPFEKYGIRASGPFIMWRTQRGRDLIDKLAKPARFWRSYATLAKVICLIVAIFIMALLIWEATLVNRIPEDKAPSPEMMLGIPGINPVIPIVYGIIGLIVAIVVHEFAHGILTRVGKLSLKSLGIILLVVPLGAFVEPDEQQLTTTDRKKRSNVYAVGPATNIIVALVCALLFSSMFMASAQPVRDNPVVVGIGDNSPASHAGLLFGMQIVEVIGFTVIAPADIERISLPDPGSNVTITYYYKNALESRQVTSGLALVEVSQNLAAYNAGLTKGMIIASLNDTTIRNQTDLESTLAKTRPHQTVNITALAYYPNQGGYAPIDLHTISLGSKLEYYQKVNPSLINSTFKDVGFLGINSAYVGALLTTPDKILQRLAHPLTGVDDTGKFIGATLLYIALPFQGLAPVESPLADLFVPGGALGGLPAGVFWFIGNSLYWIFWINLMVGMTNVLPAVPLDGGYLFKDALESLILRVKKNATERDRQRYVSNITYILAITVFFLIIWQLIGPRLL